MGSCSGVLGSRPEGPGTAVKGYGMAVRVPEQLRELENSCRGLGKQLLGVGSEELIRACAGTWPWAQRQG